MFNARVIRPLATAQSCMYRQRKGDGQREEQTDKGP